MIRLFAFGIALWLGAMAVLSAASAQTYPLSVTDVTGRTVTIDKPIKRIILGEGRYISTLGLFDRDNPVKRVVGMLNDLKRGNPLLRDALAAKFPEFNKIELFGEHSADSVSAEKILSLKPDLAIFGIQDHGPGAKNKELLAQLEAAGVKIVFIDFRMDPFKNTLPSLKMLGKVLNQEKNGNEYIAFYQKQLDMITQRLKGYKGPKPTAFLQVHVGRFPCCYGMAKGMLGPYLNFVGAKNISAEVAPGPVGRHTMEFLLQKNPEIWIGTASGTRQEFSKGKAMILLGPGIDQKLAQKSIQRAVASQAMQNLKAVKNGRVHGIWHNYYNSPFNIVAVMNFAKWIHPDLFKDVAPEKTMAQIYQRFLSYKLDGVYAISLQNKN